MIHKLALFTYLNTCIQVCNVQGRDEAIEALQMKSIIDTVRGDSSVQEHGEKISLLISWLSRWTYWTFTESKDGPVCPLTCEGRRALEAETLSVARGASVATLTSIDSIVSNYQLLIHSLPIRMHWNALLLAIWLVLRWNGYGCVECGHLHIMPARQDCGDQVG